MGADGTDRRRLTTSEAFDGSPNWSPDGKRIAFTRIAEPGAAPARSGIFVINADGGHELQITRARRPSVDLSPAWSPDGSKIAFTCAAPSAGSEDPRAALYVVTPEGGRFTKLTDDGAEPAWSPDGERIAFTSFRAGLRRTCLHECATSGELYLVDAYAGEVERLTESEADDRSPEWSAYGPSLPSYPTARTRSSTRTRST